MHEEAFRAAARPSRLRRLSKTAVWPLSAFTDAVRVGFLASVILFVHPFPLSQEQTIGPEYAPQMSQAGSQPNRNAAAAPSAGAERRRQ